MKASDYLDRLLPQYEAYFDTDRPFDVQGVRFEAHCAFSNRNEKYVLVKRAQLWATECHEHVFFMQADRLDLARFEEAAAFLKQTLEPRFVVPRKDHMYTYLTLVFLCDGVELDAAKMLRRFHFERNYRLSIYGWCTARVLAVDLTTGSVISNGQGKEVKKVLATAYLA